MTSKLLSFVRAAKQVRERFDKADERRLGSAHLYTFWLSGETGVGPFPSRCTSIDDLPMQSLGTGKMRVRTSVYRLSTAKCCSRSSRRTSEQSSGTRCITEYDDIGKNKVQRAIDADENASGQDCTNPRQQLPPNRRGQAVSLLPAEVQRPSGSLAASYGRYTDGIPLYSFSAV
jgi:hypothetical protein